MNIPSHHHNNVSIHAPARGATSANKANILAQQFQFTLPRGERPSMYTLSPSMLSFQFTLPRGERLPTMVLHLNPSEFQFTLPRGERRSGGCLL